MAAEPRRTYIVEAFVTARLTETQAHLLKQRLRQVAADAVNDWYPNDTKAPVIDSEVDRLEAR